MKHVVDHFKRHDHSSPMFKAGQQAVIYKRAVQSSRVTHCSSRAQKELLAVSRSFGWTDEQIMLLQEYASCQESLLETQPSTE